MSNIVKVDSSKFNEFYNGSFYTIEGVCGDLEEYYNGYNDIFAKEKIGHIDKMFTFTGKDMNDYYNLTGDNRYPDDLGFLCFSLANLNVPKLSFIKLVMHDRWFDDIVDNNLRREESHQILN